MKTVLVIGGGVTGLSAMYELNKWKKENDQDIRLVLAESAEQLGGKIRTVREGGFTIEAGADSIVARKADAMNFIQELGLEEEVVYNAAGRSYIYTDGELKLIPADSVFGIPASVESLAKSTLVSAEGKVEALKDFYTKNDRFTKNDSIGDFLEHFFGKELVEKQIAPVLSGVYSGNLSELTIASTLPQVFDYKEKYGSIIRGFEENKKVFQSGGGKKFLSFNKGLDTLIDAYEERLDGTEIVKSTQAVKIEKTDRRYKVDFSNGESLEADHIVLGIPHNAAAVLFDDEELKAEFEPLKNSSLISIYLAYDIPDSELLEDGTGFITANTDELTCNACTWTSRKWKHTSESGNLLVRLFYKSSHPAFASLKEMGEEELLKTALADIEKSLGITAEPAASEVTNWTEKMPNYLISHPETVAAIESRLGREYPGIWLAGCSYYGVGIPDCIENGAETAGKIIEKM